MVDRYGGQSDYMNTYILVYWYFLFLVTGHVTLPAWRQQLTGFLTRWAQQRRVSCHGEFPIHVSEYATRKAGWKQTPRLATASERKSTLKGHALPTLWPHSLDDRNTRAFNARLFTILQRHARTGGVSLELTSAKLNRLVAVFLSEWK